MVTGYTWVSYSIRRSWGSAKLSNWITASCISCNRQPVVYLACTTHTIVSNYPNWHLFSSCGLQYKLSHKSLNSKAFYFETLISKAFYFRSSSYSNELSFLKPILTKTHSSNPQHNSVSMHIKMHYIPTTTDPTAFHSPSLHTTNKHSIFV